LKITKNHIIKYLNGELAASVCHEIEKRMLDDPFLDEAIEGLRQIDNPERIDQMLTSIENEINSRVSFNRDRSKINIFYTYRWGIAATIALFILTAAWIIIFQFPDGSQSRLAQREDPDHPDREVLSDKKMDSTGIIKESLSSKEGPALTMTEEDQLTVEDLKDEVPGESDLASQESKENTSLSGAGAGVKEDGDELTFIETEPVVGEQISVVDVEIAFADEQEVEPERIPSEVLKTAKAQKTYDQPISQQDLSGNRVLNVKRKAKPSAVEGDERSMSGKLISGTVYSSEGNIPLAGANVVINSQGIDGGGGRGVVTDKNGMYTVTLRGDEDVILVTTIGYLTAEITIDVNGVQNIHLKPDVSSQFWIAVTGISGETNIGNHEFDRFPAPEGGRNEFAEYVDERKEYPLTTEGEQAAGIVIVRFNVSELGILSDFEVIRSLGQLFDKEAVRLIQNGPLWNPAIINGIPIAQEVLVAFRFSPKK